MSEEVIKKLSDENKNNNWREPVTQDDILPNQLVEVVAFDPNLVFTIKAYAERNFEDPNNGVKTKASSEQEISTRG